MATNKGFLSSKDLSKQLAIDERPASAQKLQMLNQFQMIWPLAIQPAREVIIK